MNMSRPGEKQLAVCRRYGLPPTTPEAMVAVALDSLGRSPLYGTRIALSPGGTVSWFFHAGEHSDAEDFYQALHTCHLQDVLPQVLAYLFLPPGARFIIDDAGYEDVWLDKALGG